MAWSVSTKVEGYVIRPTMKFASIFSSIGKAMIRLTLKREFVVACKSIKGRLRNLRPLIQARKSKSVGRHMIFIPAQYLANGQFELM